MTDKIISLSDRSSGQPNTRVTVPVIINDAINIIGIDLEVQFNNQILDLISVKNGNLTSGWSINKVETANSNVSTVKIGAFNTISPPSGVGSIFLLEFKINNSASLDSSSILKLEKAKLSTISSSNFDIALDSGKITVSNEIFGNSGPIDSSPISTQDIEEDMGFNFQIPSNTFADLNENETLVYSANLLDGNTLTKLPSWLSFDPQTRTLTGTPKNEDVGSFQVRLKVADGEAETAQTDFTIKVINVNDLPEVINPISDTSILINKPLNLTISRDTFRDIDGDDLTYSATLDDDNSLPDWLTFDPNTLSFSGTPTTENVGELKIKVEATDASEGKVSDTFNLKVISSNSAPIIANSLADVSTDEDEFFSWQIAPNAFSDPDYDSLSYSASLENGNLLPSWLQFNPTTLLFFGTPRNANVGPESIKITVNDGNGGNVSDLFQLTVNNVNDAPQLTNPISNQISSENSLLNFSIPTNTFTDQDGDNLIYSAILSNNDFLPDWLTFNPQTLTFSGTPSNQDVGTISLKIVADDGNGGQVNDIFSLTITEVINPFPWDINADEIVTPTDVIFIINRLGQAVNNNNQLADVNGDQIINQADAIANSEHLGETMAIV